MRGHTPVATSLVVEILLAYLSRDKNLDAASMLKEDDARPVGCADDLTSLPKPMTPQGIELWAHFDTQPNRLPFTSSLDLSAPGTLTATIAGNITVINALDRSNFCDVSQPEPKDPTVLGLRTMDSTASINIAQRYPSWKPTPYSLRR